MHTPNVSGALWGLTSESQFALLKKSIVDHELVEENLVVLRFQGNLQAVRQQTVLTLREGERDWKFWNLLTKTQIPPDSIISDAKGQQYRVMSLGDWSESGYFSYLINEQPPQGAPAAAYATGDREPIKVLADCLQNGLGLSDDAVVIAYEKNIIPKTNGLYISLDYIGPAKCIANVNELNAAGEEIQSNSYSQLVQMDLMSYDASARRRKEEATMSIASIYAIQQMELYSMSISRNPSPWVDTSSLEPTKRLNRFTSRAQIFSVHRRVIANPPYYNTFPGQITEGGPLMPFSPQPLLEI